MVQLWVVDGRAYGFGRTELVSCPGMINTATLSYQASGQYVYGVFTALNPQEVLTLTPNVSLQITAIQLRDLGASTVNLNPTNLVTTITGGELNFSWPADHIGWRLLVQTNNLDAGISVQPNDWTSVTGSAATNQISIPLDTSKPTEFYRLVFP